MARTIRVFTLRVQKVSGEYKVLRRCVSHHTLPDLQVRVAAEFALVLGSDTLEDSDKTLQELGLIDGTILYPVCSTDERHLNPQALRINKQMLRGALIWKSKQCSEDHLQVSISHVVIPIAWMGLRFGM